MSIERVFLNWNDPLIPQAAAWLWDHGCEAEAGNESRSEGSRACDLSNVIVVVPGARAGNRLLDLLVSKTKPITGSSSQVSESNRIGIELLPPQIQTIGTFPELLYRAKRPFASSMVQRLTWVSVLQELTESDLGHLVQQGPSFKERSFWLEIGELLANLSRELASEVLDFEDVLRAGRQLPRFPESDRWRVLSQLQKSYLATLDKLGLWDKQTARRFAIQHAQSELRNPGSIVLVGTVDLNRSIRKMLEAMADRVSIHCLTFSDESLSHTFDDLGCLEVADWHQRTISIPDSSLELADGPVDQASALVARLGEWCGEDEQPDTTVGIADANLVGVVQRRFDEVKQHTRWLGGRSLRESLPFRLLDSLATYLEKGKFADFAALVRHPDMKRWIGAIDESDNWLSKLDEYQNERLPLRFDASIQQEEPRLRGGKEPVVGFLMERIQTLIRPLQQGSGEWGQRWRVLGEVLFEVYGGQEANREHPSGKMTFECIRAIGEALDQFAEVPDPIAIPLTASESIRVLLDQLTANSVVMPRRDGELELSGWLDLPWEDSSNAIICGVNEGVVPSAERNDLFLPDRLRASLGLLDNTRRYARDAYALTLLQQSKTKLHLILGKRDIEGNPLSPSRLLFAVDESTIGERASAMFAAPEAMDWPLSSDGEDCVEERFLRIPQPDPKSPILSELSVTRFSTYLACPYRFYLSEVLGLAPCHDRTEEIAGNVFGTLMHDVLERFGTSEIRHSDDEKEIAGFLTQRLDQLFSFAFAKSALPTVAVQKQQIKRRLEAFAGVQAHRVKQGWRIWETEVQKLRHELVVDDIGFAITGRIDRIDIHEGSGDFQLLDYKSSDSPKTPEKSHRTKDRWTNLQLPLYRHLAREIDTLDGELRLGFFVLPKDVGKIEVMEAKWSESELEQADETARNVIRALRERKYWPPAELANNWEDPMAAICQVGIFDRHPDDMPIDNPFAVINQELP